MVAIDHQIIDARDHPSTERTARDRAANERSIRERRAAKNERGDRGEKLNDVHLFIPTIAATALWIPYITIKTPLE